MRISDWSSDVCSSDLKSPGNPVCEVDLEIDALLRTRLSALLPDAGWLSEETVDNEDRLAKDRVWVVDPIDGTRDYIRGRERWAVSIALVEHGQPVIGLIDFPPRAAAFRAAAWPGATPTGVPIPGAPRPPLARPRLPPGRP